MAKTSVETTETAGFVTSTESDLENTMSSRQLLSVTSDAHCPALLSFFIGEDEITLTERVLQK
jgi:hypothetical protein